MPLNGRPSLPSCYATGSAGEAARASDDGSALYALLKKLGKLTCAVELNALGVAIACIALVSGSHRQ